MTFQKEADFEEALIKVLADSSGSTASPLSFRTVWTDRKIG